MKISKPEKFLDDMMLSSAYFADTSAQYLGEDKTLLVRDDEPTPPYRIAVKNKYGNVEIYPITREQAVECLRGVK